LTAETRWARLPEAPGNISDACPDRDLPVLPVQADRATDERVVMSRMPNPLRGKIIVTVATSLTRPFSGHLEPSSQSRRETVSVHRRGARGVLLEKGVETGRGDILRV